MLRGEVSFCSAYSHLLLTFCFIGYWIVNTTVLKVVAVLLRNSRKSMSLLLMLLRLEDGIIPRGRWFCSFGSFPTFRGTQVQQTRAGTLVGHNLVGHNFRGHDKRWIMVDLVKEGSRNL